MAEEWRVIPEFPNYEASDAGRIRHRYTGYVRKPIQNEFGVSRTRISAVKNGKTWRHVE